MILCRIHLARLLSSERIPSASFIFAFISLLETKLLSSNRMPEPEHCKISFGGKNHSCLMRHKHKAALMLLPLFFVFFADTEDIET